MSDRNKALNWIDEQIDLCESTIEHITQDFPCELDSDFARTKIAKENQLKILLTIKKYLQPQQTPKVPSEVEEALNTLGRIPFTIIDTVHYIKDSVEMEIIRNYIKGATK